MSDSIQLVLLRHGESLWNLENRFTGWVDVGLSPRGVDEARRAGALLKSADLTFDSLHTSLLQRAITTANLVLEELGQVWLPVRRSWRLNERHYGALQGLDKKETARQHGDAQVALWRRSYDVRPPALDTNDAGHPRFDRRYAQLAADALPSSECLHDTVVRMLPYWHDRIVPELRVRRRLLVVAHGNSLRALVKHLDGIGDDDIAQLNIPTGVPLVYELDGALKSRGRRYLGDPEAVQAAAAAVAAQSSR